MSFQLEQVMVKLGIDQSQVAPSLSTFTNRVEEATNHAHKSFLHAESGGRAFHKVLEKINETIPGMGPAVTAFINPTTGLLAALAAGFTMAQKAIEDWNKKLDEQGKLNQEAIWGIKEINEAKEGVRELAAEWAKYKQSLTPGEPSQLPGGIKDEADPKKRKAAADFAAQRLADEREAMLREGDALNLKQQHLEKRKTQIPGELTAAQGIAQSIEKGGPAEFMRDDTLEEITAAPGRYERTLRKAQDRVHRLTNEQGANAEGIRLTKERAKLLEGGISERQRAISELQDISQASGPFDPHAFAFGPKRSGKFSISDQSGRAPSGFIEVMTDMNTHLETLASAISGGQMLVKPSNGQ